MELNTQSFKKCSFKKPITINLNKTCNNVTKFITLAETSLFTFLLSVQMSFADDGKVLTDLFDSEAFRGSWSWFDKFNYLGLALNFIISAFCFISLFAICLQTILTVSYFSLRPFWDNVHDIKKENMNKRAFGIEGYLQGTWMGKSGSGLDAFVHLFYIFLPDIKELSEMGDSRDNNLNEDDTIGTWFVKTFPKKILIMLLLSMGFNGSLMKCYGMVVDGAGAAMDRVANYQMADLVNRVLDSGDNFDFNLGDDNTAMGKTREAMAKKVYSFALSKTGVTDASVKQQIGSNIQQRIRNTVTNATMTEALIANGQEESLQLSDDDWKYIKYNAVCNTDSTEASGSFVIPLSEVVPKGEWNKENYVHITPVLKKRAPVHDYINS